jgi:hypothetical protein
VVPVNVMGGLAVLALVLVIYSAVARGLARWSISMPIIFVALGLLIGPAVFDLLNATITAESVRVVTEVHTSRGSFRGRVYAEPSGV